ncbi:DnaJ C-terminal domain-containing protein [Asticcacaulis solisilvae]|uniref:DnaJ C-terminal domain-containing protein n=1 Tax=Asticcacaulis solisilvae TaxID=1217274 RepID=UPI003FD8BFFE
MDTDPISDLPLTHPDAMARIDALAELGLNSGADEAAIRNAFRTRLKEAHPDLNGGTDLLLRRIILARDLLMSESRRTAEKTRWLQDFAANDHDRDGALLLNITLQQAIYGGEVVESVPALEISTVDEPLTSLTDMKRLRILLPAGLRDGDKLRLTVFGAARPEQLFRIHVVTEANAHIDGDDIHVTANVEARIYFAGGRAVIATPHGPREVDIARGQTSVVLPGLGLPATGRYGRGDLHLTLKPAGAARKPWTEARDEFRRKWAC